MQVGRGSEPQSFYENYWPDCVLTGANPAVRPAPGRRTARFDLDELAAAFNDRTKAIILCNPNNLMVTGLLRDPTWRPSRLFAGSGM